MPVSKQDCYTLATQHPAMPALRAFAEAHAKLEKAVITDALRAWIVGHGAGDLIDWSAPRPARCQTPLSLGKTPTLYLQPIVNRGVHAVRARLGLTLTQAVSSALAWRFNVKPGRYPNRRGVSVVILGCGYPPMAWDQVDASPPKPALPEPRHAFPKPPPAFPNQTRVLPEPKRPAPKPRIAGPVRRETPALLAFEAVRRVASEMGHPLLVVPPQAKAESQAQTKPAELAVRLGFSGDDVHDRAKADLNAAMAARGLACADVGWWSPAAAWRASASVGCATVYLWAVDFGEQGLRFRSTASVADRNGHTDNYRDAATALDAGLRLARTKVMGISNAMDETHVALTKAMRLARQAAVLSGMARTAEGRTAR